MQTRRGNQKPVVEVLTLDQQPLIKQHKAEKITTERALNEHKQQQKPTIAKWLESLDPKDPNAIPEPADLAHHFPFFRTPLGFPPQRRGRSVVKSPAS